MKGPRIIAMASALALVAMFGTASAVLGHNVQSISGTVDCSGNYSITVKGDVYNPVTLNVKLDGAVIYGPTLQGTDTSVRDFGPFTGTGATAGEAISASTSDGSSASGVLVADPASCPTPTDPPTTPPTKAPTPVPCGNSSDAQSSPCQITITPPPTGTTAPGDSGGGYT